MVKEKMKKTRMDKRIINELKTNRKDKTILSI